MKDAKKIIISIFLTVKATILDAQGSKNGFAAVICTARIFS